MERVKDPTDPERCKGAAPDGQCWNRAEHGSDYCLAHGGKSTALAESKRAYLLVDVQRRVRLAQLAEHDDIKSLREEIALARLLVEKRLNACKNDEELIASAGAINTMLLTLERLVKSANTIEQNLGTLLAKSAVLKLGQSICHIVVEELEHVDGYEIIVDRITRRMIDTISHANNNEVLAITGPSA
jgi:hypothetical protein